MTPKSMLLPQAVRQAREARQWTQMELANRLSVSQGTISFWERGVEAPSLEHLVALVTVLPEIFEQLAEHEAQILARLYDLERAVNSGRCGCSACGCRDS